MSEKELMIRCRKHNEKYDANQGRCPKCEADVSALEHVRRVLTCQLCGEIKASTTIYCGGPIGQMCNDCRDIVYKWEDAKDAHEAFWERRRIETDSQIFFRATFDNDPVEFIWG